MSPFDPPLSPETRTAVTLSVPVLQAMVGDAPSDPEQLGQAMDAALESVTPGMLPEDVARHARRNEIVKQAFRMQSKMAAALRSGDEATAAALKAEAGRMEAEIKAIGAYLGFPAAAEALHRARDFDTFTDLLPQVDLTQVYGTSGDAHSRFPLVWAMEARDRPLERVQAMLRAGVRVDLRGYMGTTVLHAMAGAKRKNREVRLSILRALVFHGADLEARDLLGRTPLVVAASEGSIEDMENFLCAGADPNGFCNSDRIGACDYGVVPLTAAAETPEKVRLLLDHGANPAFGLRNGATVVLVLRAALAFEERLYFDVPEKKRATYPRNRIRAGIAASLALVEQALGVAGPVPARRATFAEDPRAFVAVETAATLDDLRAALERVEIETYVSTVGIRPIFWPLDAKTERPERLWLMLKAGASVEGDPRQGTALHWLAQQNRRGAGDQARLVQMLLQHGGQIEARDHDDMTPLARAVASGGAAEVTALLAAGGRVSYRYRGRSWTRAAHGDTLLMAAATVPAIFRVLLDNGADPDLRTMRGKTLRDVLDEKTAVLDAELTQDLSNSLRRTSLASRNGIAKSLAMLG